LPNLASLRFVLNEENGKMLAHRIIPVVGNNLYYYYYKCQKCIGIRPGYRHIMLRNAFNQPFGLATLFVKIGVKDFVPEVHMGRCFLSLLY